MRLNLPSAKTAKLGEIQSVYMVPQEELCPLEALQNLAKVVPAGKSDPLFSWRDRTGSIHPMVKSTAINHINSILKAWGWGTTFGHSFRIDGASFYLSQKVDPEIIWTLVAGTPWHMKPTSKHSNTSHQGTLGVC
jgi:hypothetical protein